MIHKIVIVVPGLIAAATSALWIVSLHRPIEYCSGPSFHNVRWRIERRSHDIGWNMSHRDTFVARVLVSEAPVLWPRIPDRWLLLGVGFGGLHIGKAYFRSDFGPAPPPGYVNVRSWYQ